MTKTELARDLGISQPYVTKLVAQGLVTLDKDGRVNSAATMELLYRHWSPSEGWWTKRVGPLGQELRRRWRADEQRCAIRI